MRQRIIQRIIKALLNFQIRTRRGPDQMLPDGSGWMTFYLDPTWSQRLRLWILKLLNAPEVVGPAKSGRPSLMRRVRSDFRWYIKGLKDGYLCIRIGDYRLCRNGHPLSLQRVEKFWPPIPLWNSIPELWSTVLRLEPRWGKWKIEPSWEYPE